MIRVLFTLRSNVGWFQTPELRSVIDTKLKQAILTFDEILVEDGTYMLEATSDTVWAPYAPPGHLPNEQRTILYERDLRPGEMTLAVAPGSSSTFTAIARGHTTARYKIDYFDILKDLTTEHEFLRRIILSEYNFPPDARQMISDESSRDRSRLSALNVPSVLKNTLIQGLNHDLVSASLCDAAIILDHTHQEVLHAKAACVRNPVHSVPEDVAVAHLLNVAAPNLQEMSINEVVEHREKSQWRDFRSFVGELVDDIKRDPEKLVNKRALEDDIRQRVSRTLFNEIERLYPSYWRLAVDLGLGALSVIPGVGLIATGTSGAKSIAEQLRNRKVWYAFLLQLTKTR